MGTMCPVGHLTLIRSPQLGVHASGLRTPVAAVSTARRYDSVTIGTRVKRRRAAVRGSARSMFYSTSRAAFPDASGPEGVNSRDLPAAGPSGVARVLQLFEGWELVGRRVRRLDVRLPN